MFGLLYLILCVLVGRELTEHFLLRRVRESAGNRFWLLFPMSFGIGTLLLTWMVYGISYIASVYGESRYPLLTGNLVVISITVVCLYYRYQIRRKSGRKVVRKDWINDLVLFRKEAAFFAVLFLFVMGTFQYVFFIKNSYLYSGLTVFSDYAPHTSMIRSFSFGNNFPTQYPHYGGEDVKYHFMFQFLTGNLEYLGLRIDFAYNLISTLSLWSFLVMLYKLSGRIMGRYLTGAIAILFFFFRSGLSFYRFAWEHLQAGDLVQTLAENTQFIGYTPNENWGLWCYNVYLNQRHLPFALLIVSVALWIFMDWLEDGEEHPEKGLEWMKQRLFSKEAWKTKDLPTAVLIGILMGLAAFWNGAAVIGGLLILAGFALFSDGKLDYAVMAFLTILLSEIQTKVFMNESAVQPSFHWGLLAEDPSFAGGIWYLVQLSSVYFLGLAVLCFFVKRLQRSAMFAFSLPVFFAFTISLTPDIAVNHKYVMIAFAFLGMFWAYVFISLWRKRHGAQILAVLLALCLFATGIYDFVIIIKDNDSTHRIMIPVNSDVTEWLADHLTDSELILTPEYSINEVTMSGVMMYCGWPYYAWSAGYDTYRRSAIATDIYTSEDRELIKILTEEEKIQYILFDEGMDIEGIPAREDVIAELYHLVYTSESGRIRIYRVLNEEQIREDIFYEELDF